ncbi:hypothetical protein F4678DRAFT_109138 [Xylaria arbuscula]|nr:hypothetical protein F4678DRAFT_109138 [Xylaria arbuscula]
MTLSSRIKPTLCRAITHNKRKLQTQHPAASISYITFSIPTQQPRPLLQTSGPSPKPLGSVRLLYSTPAISRSSHNASSSLPTMESSETKTEGNNVTQPESQSPANPASLPALPAAGDGAPSTLEVGGPALRLDHLGPLVVNEDGTLSRIANWEKMADIERENTLRIRKLLPLPPFFSIFSFLSPICSHLERNSSFASPFNMALKKLHWCLDATLTLLSTPIPGSVIM